MAYVILFDFRPLFSTYVDQPVRLLGLSPLTDQKLAGRRDDGRADRDRRRSPSSCCCAPRGASASRRAAPMLRQRRSPDALGLVVHVRAAVRRSSAAVALVGLRPGAGGASGAGPRPRRVRGGRAPDRAALNSPLETIAVDYLVLFHLLQNVIISDWAPPLLLARPDPRDARGDRRARRRAVRRSSPGPTVALPGLARRLVRVHLGGVYDVALRNPWLLNVEHLFMIAIGLLFWWPVIADEPALGADARPDRVRLRRVRALGVPRPRPHVRAAALRLLRGPARAAVGDLGREGPEPRRHPDDAPSRHSSSSRRSCGCSCGCSARRTRPSGCCRRSSRAPGASRERVLRSRRRSAGVVLGELSYGGARRRTRTASVRARAARAPTGATARVSRACSSVVRTISFARAKLSSSVGTGPTRFPSA